MIAVETPVLVHEIEYRSSSARDLTLQILTVRYTATRDVAPTFLATADLQGREKHARNRLLCELAANEIIALKELIFQFDSILALSRLLRPTFQAKVSD